MLQIKQKTTTHPSQKLRNPRLIPWLVISIFMLALLCVSCVAHLALRYFTPYASQYDGSLLAVGQADYSPWGAVPLLPPLNPLAADAIAATNNEETRIPPENIPVDVVPVTVIEVPPHTPTLTTPPPTPSPTVVRTPVSAMFLPPPTARASTTPSSNSPTVGATQASDSSADVAPTNTPPPSATTALSILVPTDSLATATQATVPSATAAPLTVTNTPLPSSTSEPTQTPKASRTPTEAATATPTQTAIPASTNTPTVTPSATNTATATATNTATATATATTTATPTNTVEPTATSTQTPSATATATATPTQIVTQTPTAAGVLTTTATITPVQTATPTVEPTNTVEPTVTPTNTVEPTATPTNTVEPTATPTQTPLPLVDVQFKSTTYNVDEDAGEVLIFVRLSKPAGQTVTVDYATVDGTATAADNDYNPTSGTLTFGPNDVSRVIRVPIINDTLAEPDESFQVVLSNSVNVNLGTPDTTTITIADDEPKVQFGSGSYTVDEDDGTAIIDVELTSPVGATVTVDYAVTGGSATDGSDYTVSNGSLTFPPNVTNQTITVSIVDNLIGETYEETVELMLSNPNNSASIGWPATTTVKIIDDEPRIQFDQSTFTVDEDVGMATIEVTLNKPIPQVVTVDYTTSDDEATAGSDYTPTSGTLTFAPNVTNTTFQVPILDDLTGEQDEELNLTLSNPSSNSWLKWINQATLQIMDDEPRVNFKPGSYTVSEDAGSVAVELELTKAASAPVTVTAMTSDGSAKAGSDFMTASQAFTFAPGQTDGVFFTVNITDDLDGESNEKFSVTLSNPSSNASVGGPATVTIQDNEPRIRFDTSSYSVDENAGTATITVIRQGPTTPTVTVDYEVENDSATAGSDYTATNGTLIFGSGQTIQTFTVNITNDLIHERDEQVKLKLTNLSDNASFGSPNSATLTIRDDEPAPIVRLSTTNYSVNEGLGEVTVEVELSTPSERTIRVEYTTNDGTAVAGDDYLRARGTLTFNPGQTRRSFTTKIINDSDSEADETVNLELSNPRGGATLIPGDRDTALLTIVDND